MTSKAALRRCTLNESASYWFGYTNCFGNVCYKQGIPIDALDSNEIDLSHLINFWELVNSISFFSERMANAHAPFGVVSKKCLNGEIKGGIANYSRHVWRGLIDGDGSLGVYEGNKPQWNHHENTVYLSYWK